MDPLLSEKIVQCNARNNKKQKKREEKSDFEWYTCQLILIKFDFLGNFYEKAFQ